VIGKAGFDRGAIGIGEIDSLVSAAYSGVGLAALEGWAEEIAHISQKLRETIKRSIKNRLLEMICFPLGANDLSSDFL
jgi:hypothetical protein